MDEATVVAALRDIAASGWERRPPLPTYLSVLPRMLRERLGGDYTEALGGETLKSFIQRTAVQNQYQLLTHPTQRAKLVIIPYGVNYEFDIPNSKALDSTLTTEDVASFGNILNSLAPQVLAQWSIPATLVLKLISSK